MNVQKDTLSPPPARNKIFGPIRDVEKYIELINNKEKPLFECPIFQRKKGCQINQKIKFIRLYQQYMLISKSKSFVHFKILYYSFEVMINFQYEAKTIKSIEFVAEGQNLEFFSPNHFDLLNLNKILKTKLNLLGFHEQFKAIKKIGRGNFATVYLANNIIDRKDYAVKSLSKQYIKKKKNGLLALQNEIMILRSVDHQNIIKLDCVYETLNSFYIVLELFSGGNLHEYIKEKGVLTENSASTILKNVLMGVQYLHMNKIMHRDIKPENILFRTTSFVDDKQVALADLGLATYTNVEKYIYPRCGTPGFVAPEISANGDPDVHYDPKCDLFSVGITLYYALTGKMPYPGKNEIMKENKESTFDFNRSEKFNKLSIKAKDLISKLICSVEKRLDVNEALNHDFFSENVNKEEDLEEDSEATQRTYNIPSINIYELNSRKPICHQMKNSLIVSPVSSPLLKLSKNTKSKRTYHEASLTFVCLTPLLNGYTKTVKSIPFNYDEENLLNEVETENEISRITSHTASLMTSGCKKLIQNLNY